MKVNYRGCAICDSTWGDLWAEVEGQRLFFCCATCLTQLQGLVDRVKAATRWPKIDSLEIAGDRRGRTCTARRGEEAFRFFIRFDPEGTVQKFAPLLGPPAAPEASAP